MGVGLDGLHGGVHGSALPRVRWTALHALYDRVWPGMAARLRNAAVLGAPWARYTTPFAMYEGGRAVATVGVLEHPVVLDGREVTVCGFHAVCTDPDHRGRGLCKRVLAAAVSWAEQRYELIKLSTASPGVFTSSGFRRQPTHTFHASIDARGGDEALRPLDLREPGDLASLRQRLELREPLSRVFATRDEGWLLLIDAALARVTASWFYEAPALDAILVVELGDDSATLHDVIAARIPTLDEIAAVLPRRCQRLTMTFTPDRVAPADMVEAREKGEDDALMVYGPWPELPELGLPPVWEH